MRAIQMTEFGGPEVLRLAELPTPEPPPGHALIEVTRAGMNFADTHTRTNTYVQKATLPLIPGGEVAGTLQETGERVLKRLLVASMACVLVWQLACSVAPQASAARELLAY